MAPRPRSGWDLRNPGSQDMVLQPPQSRGFLDGGQGDLCPVAQVPVHPELSQTGEGGQGGREGGQLVTLQGEHLGRKGGIYRGNGK